MSANLLKQSSFKICYITKINNNINIVTFLLVEDSNKILSNDEVEREQGMNYLFSHV